MPPTLLRNPDPSIEQIEAELLKARFSETPAEEYLTERARKRMQESDIAREKDEKVRAAFVAGYRFASTERAGPWKGFLIGLGLAAFIFAYIILASQG